MLKRLLPLILLITLAGCGASRDLRIQQGLATVAEGNGALQQGAIQLEEANVINGDQAATVIIATRTVAEIGLSAIDVSEQLPESSELLLAQLDRMVEALQTSTRLPDLHPFVAGALTLLRNNLITLRTLVEVQADE